MTAAETAYQELLAHLRQMSLVLSAQELLAWDELTLLPDEATDHRARQLSELAGLHHALATDPRIDAWLAEVEASPLVADQHGPAATNVRETRRHHYRLCKLPRSLVEEIAQVTAVAQHEWKLARQQNDFPRFAPWLERVLVLKRDEARCLAEGSNPYDALLAEYEPGLTTAELARLFRTLEAELSTVVPQIVDAQRRAPQPTALLCGDFAEAAQRTLCFNLAVALGFDLTRGRIDTAVHPFTSQLGPNDCRIAIRYSQSHLRESLYALLHEVGHALYDQALPVEHFGTPAGEGASLGLHESQARLWENAVGRSLGFWQHFFPQVRRAFPAAFARATPDAVWREVNRVEPGVNRVAADEATYNLHILLRVELEQALLAGELAVADLPAAWNARHQALLGVEPTSDREGCLQDGHWAAGMFGYFPTYTIGNLLAAQLFECAGQSLGDLTSQFAAGNFQPLLGWLKFNLHRHGKRFTTAEFARQVCGSDLHPHAFVAALSRRHQELWLP